jgi:hypothetical protein
MKRLLAAPLACLVGLLAGCLKMKEDLTIFPDGSGRLLITMSIKEDNEMAKGKFTEEEIMSEDPEKMLKEMPGIVAFTRPKLEKKGGFATVTMTAYFEDVSKVRIIGESDGDGKALNEFKFRKEGEGFVFEVGGDKVGEGLKELGADENAPPELKKQMEAMIKEMMKGFEFTVRVKMPGAVTSVETFQAKEGRTATFTVGEKDIAGPADMKKISGMNKLKAVCGPSQVSADEQAAFKAEMEKAKAEWAELKKEMKANFDKKPKDK